MPATSSTLLTWVFMKISNLSLPYPVLGVHDDIVGKYEITGPDITTRPEITEIKLVHVLGSHEIHAMVQAGMAEYVTQVHCMKTAYRRCFSTTTNSQSIEVNSNDLRDRVDLEFFVIAAQEIAGYQPAAAHPDYEGFQFRLTRGDVLAHGGTTNFVSEKQWMGSEAVGSFMVLEQGDFKAGPMRFVLDRSKITIILSKDDFDRHRLFSVSRSFDRIFHSALVLPALVYAVTQMVDATDTYQDLKWFQVLEDRKTNDPALTGESWDIGNAPVIAQLLLSNPMDRTLSSLWDLVDQNSFGAE